MSERLSLTPAEARDHLRHDEVEMWDALMSPDANFVRAEYTISVRSDRELRKTVNKDELSETRARAGDLIMPLAQATNHQTMRVMLYRLACARAGIDLWAGEVLEGGTA